MAKPSRRSLWPQRVGRPVAVRDMDDAHVWNTAAFIRRKIEDGTVEVVCGPDWDDTIDVDPEDIEAGGFTLGDWLERFELELRRRRLIDPPTPKPQPRPPHKAPDPYEELDR